MCEFERLDQVRDWLFGLYDDGVFGDLGFKRPITKYSYGISSHVYMKNDLVNVSHRIIFLSFKCGVSFEINPWNVISIDRKGLKKYFFIHGDGTLNGHTEYGWRDRHLNKPEFYDWLIEEKQELEALTIAESRFGRALHPAIDIDIDESSDIELPF